jgi:hypothetical protein
LLGELPFRHASADRIEELVVFCGREAVADCAGFAVAAGLRELGQLRYWFVPVSGVDRRHKPPQACQ